jgi:hypothetical protein
MIEQRFANLRPQQWCRQQRRVGCSAKARKQPPSRRAPQRAPQKVTPKAPVRSKSRLPWRLKPKKQDSKSVDAQHGWQFLKPKAYSQAAPWQVPWGWPTIIIGTGAWAVSFVLTGILAIPIAVYGFGVVDLSSLTPLQQSQIQLLDQVRPLRSALAALVGTTTPAETTSGWPCMQSSHRCIHGVLLVAVLHHHATSMLVAAALSPSRRDWCATLTRWLAGAVHRSGCLACTIHCIASGERCA